MGDVTEEQATFYKIIQKRANYINQGSPQKHTDDIYVPFISHTLNREIDR